jgi:DNA polymerase-3 subunit gamma/tau
VPETNATQAPTSEAITAAEKAPSTSKAEVAQATKPEPTTSRPKLRKPLSTKTMDIPTDLSALKKVISKPKEDIQEKEKEPTGPTRQKSFDAATLQREWMAFVEQRHKMGLTQEVLILKEPYTLNGEQITVTIANEALEPTFEKFRGDLLQFLRDRLENDLITVRSEVREMEREKMLYTDREKFEHLKRKYPALRDLQDKLGLDPEF